MNPFRFGNPVVGEYYVAREPLRNSVVGFIENGVNVVLVGPRRFGKTSFILDIQRHLTQKYDHRCVLVDVFNITSHRDFLQQCMHALKQEQSFRQRISQWLKYIMIQPQLTVDEEGLTATFLASLGAAPEDKVKGWILELFDSVGQMGEKVTIAFDEFQRVALLNDGGWLEATIRSKMQQNPNVSFIFSGSRRSIIHDMFNNNNRPFYRSCQLIDFPSLGHEFTEWVIAKFDKVGIPCSPKNVEYIRKLVSDTPNYVQMVCYHVIAEGCKTVDQETIDNVIQTIVKQNAYAYQTIINALTDIQQRALRLTAIERNNIYAKEYLTKYEIKSGPYLSSAIKALKQKQLLDEDSKKGSVIFDDPLFALWLRTEFGN